MASSFAFAYYFCFHFLMLSFNPHEAQLMCQAGGEHELDETLATVLVRHKHVAQLDNQLDLL